MILSYFFIFLWKIIAWLRKGSPSSSNERNRRGVDVATEEGSPFSNAIAPSSVNNNGAQSSACSTAQESVLKWKANKARIPSRKTSR